MHTCSTKRVAPDLSTPQLREHVLRVSQHGECQSSYHGRVRCFGTIWISDSNIDFLSHEVGASTQRGEPLKCYMVSLFCTHGDEGRSDALFIAEPIKVVLDPAAHLRLLSQNGHTLD